MFLLLVLLIDWWWRLLLLNCVSILVWLLFLLIMLGLLGLRSLRILLMRIGIFSLLLILRVFLLLCRLCCLIWRWLSGVGLLIFCFWVCKVVVWIRFIIWDWRVWLLLWCVCLLWCLGVMVLWLIMCCWGWWCRWWWWKSRRRIGWYLKRLLLRCCLCVVLVCLKILLVFVFGCVRRMWVMWLGRWLVWMVVGLCCKNVVFVLFGIFGGGIVRK